jgi:hypothetical protein
MQYEIRKRPTQKRQTIWKKWELGMTDDWYEHDGGSGVFSITANESYNSYGLIKPKISINVNNNKYKT